MKLLRRMISLSLVLAMLCSVMPVGAGAEEIAQTEELVQTEIPAQTDETVTSEEEMLPPETEETIEETEEETVETLPLEVQETEPMLEAEGEAGDEGSCGDTMTWTLDSKGTLTISGSGEMTSTPWRDEYTTVIKKVIIEEGVTTIYGSAFYGCSSLAEVLLPSTLTEIKGSAFWDCGALTKIVLPENLTTLGQNTFYFGGLTEVTIPTSLTTWGSYTFYDCPVENLYIEDLEHLLSMPNDGGLDFKNLYIKGELVTDLVIPDGITKLYSEAFNTVACLESVTIPESVTSIGEYAFYGCENLKEVNWPGSVTAVQSYTFSKCISLTSLTLPAGVVTVNSNAFYCSEYNYTCALTELRFLGNAPLIAENGFKGVTATVYYSANNASWTEDIFQNYGGTITWMADDTIPGTGEEEDLYIVDEGSCGDTMTWTLDSKGTLTISGSGEMTSAPWRDEYTTVIKKVIIEEGVTTIYGSAFYGCSSLAEVLLPSTLTEIKGSAFWDCGALTKIVLPENLTTLGQNTFYFGGLTEVTIPTSLTTWGSYTFYDCPVENLYIEDLEHLLSMPNDGGLDFKNLYIKGELVTDLVIPDGITKLYSEAFNTVACLESVTIPESVTSIGEYAFYGCENLKEVNWPGSVTAVQSNTFGKCGSLTSLTLPAGVVTINSNAFGNTGSNYASALNEIRFLGNAPLIAETGFVGVTATVYYSANNASWTEDIFQNYGGTITWVADNTIPGSGEEEEVYIIASGTCGENVYWSLDSNGELLVYGSARSRAAVSFDMDNYTSPEETPWFAYQSQIKAVTVESTVNSIGTNAFAECTNLTEVTIEEGVSKVGDSAFSKCESLEEVTFEGSAPQFGENAFEEVEATVNYPAEDESWQAEDLMANCGGEIVLKPQSSHIHSFAFEDGMAVCRDCGMELFVRIGQEHILLQPNQTHLFQAEVSAGKLLDKVQWSVEEGGETVLSVDQQGKITALGTGTAYVVASASYENFTLTDRCRVDVLDEIIPEGIQLSTRKLTSELNSTDYAVFDVLLRLPQNYPVTASENAQKEFVDSGVAVDSARFSDQSMEKLFDLVVLDDRRVQVVPTDYAVANPKEVKSKYTASVLVTVQGEEYTSEALTLSIKKSTPKLKAKVGAFNSFFSGTSQEIVITGGTPTKITAKSIPAWLDLKDSTLTMKENGPLKSTSVKVKLLVEMEEWRVPAEVSLSVKNSYKAPGLKLSESKVTMTTLTANSEGVELKLQPKSKKDTLESLNVTGITAPSGYSIENFSLEDGTFTLKAAGTLKSGKITLKVSFSDTEVQLPLTLTVKTAEVKLKTSVKSLSLNTELPDVAAIGLTATPADYQITQPVTRLTDSKGTDKTGELEIGFEDGNVLVSTTDATPTGASYKLYISAGGSKEAVVTIKTVSGEPSVSFKSKATVDLSFPDKAAEVKPTFKNYNGTFTITGMTAETSGKKDATELFRAEVDGRTILVSSAENTAPGSYTLKLKLTLPNGDICENSAKVTVKRTAVKLKLSATKLTLNKAVNESASVNVTCTTKGYAFTKPVWELSAPGKLDISYFDGTLKVAANAETQYGATYKILVKANAASPAATLTVMIPAQNKSNITASLKASGKLDVIRSDKGVTVTPSYKNIKDLTGMQETLMFYSSADNYTKAVNDLFRYEPNGKGGYLITRAASAKLDHSLQYKAELVSVIGGTEVRSPKVSIKLTMGSSKLTVKEGSVDLFAKDKNDRAIFHLTSKDADLNTAERVQIKDAKYQDLFEIYTYGNGEFAIGFKNGKVSSKLTGKTTTVTLNVWVEGNQTEKVNTTVKLKLNIVK